MGTRRTGETVGSDRPVVLGDASIPALAGLLAYSAFAQGGYYGGQALIIAIATTVLALAVRTRPPAWIVGVLAIPAAGMLLSAAANGWPRVAWQPAATLLAAGCVLHVARAAAAAGQTDRLLRMLAWIATAVAITGLIGVAYHLVPWGLRSQMLFRAASTLTYSNATAAFLTLALPAPLILSLRKDTVVHRLQTFAIAAGIAATLSRGGFVGAVAMLAVLMVAGGRPLIARLIRPGLGAVVAGVGMLPSIASWHPRTAQALAGIAVGAIIAGVPLRLKPALRRGLAIAVVAGIGVAAVPALAAAESPAQIFVSRLSSNSDDRTIFWTAGLRQAAEHPVFGTGPGTYRGILKDRGRLLMVFYVHNEYVQIFAETGLVGLASVLAAMIAFAVALWRRRPPAGTSARILWAAAFAAGAAFAVHGFFDFMWRIPAVVLPAFVWLAIGLEQKGRNEA